MSYLGKIARLLIGLSLSGVVTPVVLAQNHDCGPLVFLNDGRLEVEASGADDTANIQCALDEAKRLGLLAVRLQRSDYSISHLEIEEFTGLFEGGGAGNTTLTLLNKGMNCAAAIAAGQAPAGIKFIRGDVKVARMTIGAGQPCEDGPPGIFFLLHFTGSPAGSVCSGETGFGFVDRAELLGLDSSLNLWGIGALAEGYLFGDCNQTLLGTFKLNRSLLAGFNTAVALSIRGSGQVDINFSDFGDNRRHLLVENANQLLTVQASEFMSFESFNEDHTGIEVYSDMGSPAQNRAVIYRNLFSLSEQDTAWIVNAVTVFETTPIQLSLVVSDNRFDIQAPLSSGMYIEGVDSATLANNRFTGSADTGMWLSEGGNATTVTGNNFEQYNPGRADIYLDAETGGLITAFNAAAIIVDDGAGNIVLSSAEPVTSLDSTGTLAASGRPDNLRMRIDEAVLQVEAILGPTKPRESNLQLAQSRNMAPRRAAHDYKNLMFRRLRPAEQQQP